MNPDVADMPEDVRAVFRGFDEATRAALLELRALIFDVAGSDPRIGQVTETLKWGQPSYLTSAPKSGTTVRLGVPRSGGYGLYVPCSTTLIADFRAEHGSGLDFDGNRGILFAHGPRRPDTLLRLFLGRAMTYHI
ncbi:MAG: DUF1801 domain-containing protein [Pseudomonadota bacterium]